MTEKNERALVTGGSGFIGCNVARALLDAGEPVLVLDNLSRPNVTKNLQWLKARYGDAIDVVVADVRDADAVRRAVERAHTVFHFAAQVAVTTSIVDPVTDFAINAGGTLNVLEAVRAQSSPPPVFFTSTNKVYGALDDVAFAKQGTRYEPTDPTIRERGIDEGRPLSFHSPYGCSKGTADQYVLDYARSYGLRSVVFRMSCIYGPRQFGTEDQGWVAHFLLRALANEPITIYGDGLQVRDVLFVDDLVAAFLAARRNLPTVSGQAFNVGGGPGNTISLIELLSAIERLTGRKPKTTFEDWRVGDQRYYVSDTRKLAEATGWAPRVSVDRGVRLLLEWLQTLRAERSESRLETAS